MVYRNSALARQSSASPTVVRHELGHLHPWTDHAGEDHRCANSSKNLIDTVRGANRAHRRPDQRPCDEPTRPIEPRNVFPRPLDFHRSPIAGLARTPADRARYLCSAAGVCCLTRRPCGRSNRAKRSRGWDGADDPNRGEPGVSRSIKAAGRRPSAASPRPPCVLSGRSSRPTGRGEIAECVAKRSRRFR
jgi:hypothetical protein